MQANYDHMLSMGQHVRQVHPQRYENPNTYHRMINDQYYQPLDRSWEQPPTHNLASSSQTPFLNNMAPTSQSNFSTKPHKLYSKVDSMEADAWRQKYIESLEKSVILSEQVASKDYQIKELSQTVESLRKELKFFKNDFIGIQSFIKPSKLVDLTDESLQSLDITLKNFVLLHPEARFELIQDYANKIMEQHLVRITHSQKRTGYLSPATHRISLKKQKQNTETNSDVEISRKSSPQSTSTPNLADSNASQESEQSNTELLPWTDLIKYYYPGIQKFTSEMTNWVKLYLSERNLDDTRLQSKLSIPPQFPHAIPSSHEQDFLKTFSKTFKDLIGEMANNSASYSESSSSNFKQKSVENSVLDGSSLGNINPRKSGVANSTQKTSTPKEKAVASKNSRSQTSTKEVTAQESLSINLNGTTNAKGEPVHVVAWMDLLKSRFPKIFDDSEKDPKACIILRSFVKDFLQKQSQESGATPQKCMAIGQVKGRPSWAIPLTIADTFIDELCAHFGNDLDGIFNVKPSASHDVPISIASDDDVSDDRNEESNFRENLDTYRNQFVPPKPKKSRANTPQTGSLPSIQLLREFDNTGQISHDNKLKLPTPLTPHENNGLDFAAHEKSRLANASSKFSEESRILNPNKVSNEYPKQEHGYFMNMLSANEIPKLGY